jgi:hypothetical protein
MKHLEQSANIFFPRRKPRRPCLALLALAALLACAAPAGAQEADAESLSRWKYSAELSGKDRGGALPGAAKYLAFTLSPEVLGKAQDGLGDLRLVDASGRRIPYAARVRSPRQEVTALEAEPFDEGVNAAQNYAQVSLRLPQQERLEHNEVEVVTAGQKFWRRVVVSASNRETFPADETHEVLDRELFQLDTDAGPVQVRKLKYPVQQARFLRVRVHADPKTDKAPPKIEKVIVRKTQSVPGVEQTRDAELGPREPVRADRGPGSAWFVRLHEDPVPVARLTFTVAGDAVTRPFRLEIAGKPTEPRSDVADAQWHWRKEGGQLFLDVTFPEVRATRLRLVVTDFANPPLDLQTVTYSAAARQVVFAPPADRALEGPLQLYFGNADATPAEYDFARDLPAELSPAPVEVAVGPRQDNPEYVPPARPLGERLPWLIYVVLGAACMVLVALLGLLARQALRRHDARQAPA